MFILENELLREEKYYMNKLQPFNFSIVVKYFPTRLFTLTITKFPLCYLLH